MTPAALALLALATPPLQALSVRSPSRAFLAEVRPTAADDPRPARRGRFELVVSEDRGELGLRPVWTALVPEPDPAFLYLLAEDGTALVAIDPRFDPERDLVEVWRKGRRTAGFDAESLALRAAEGALEAGGAWLAGAVAWRLRALEYGLSSRSYALDLLGKDGGLRTIDLANDALAVSADAGALERAVEIGPAVPRDLATPLEPVYVRVLGAPDEAVAGEPIALRVRGSFPTPGWRVVGYAVELGQAGEQPGEQPQEQGERVVRVTPYAARLAGGTAAQVITDFDESATLRVFAPGDYRLELAGRETGEQPIARALRVLPAGLFVSLDTSGGFAGLRRTIQVLRDGRLKSAAGVALIDAEAFAELVRLVAALPATPVHERTRGAADYLQYDLTWSPEGAPLSASFDEGTLAAPWRDVVRALERLADPGAAPPEPAPPPAYAIDPAASAFRVRTRTSGLLKALGHEHVIEIADFGGRAVFDPAAPQAASLELVVRAASLRLAGDADEKDRREIERTMRADVLAADAHPEIAFRTSEVRLKPLREGRYEATLVGDLALHGRTRRVALRALVELAGAELRASGRFDLLLSDYGIERPKAAGGTVNVADKVELSFDIVARR